MIKHFPLKLGYYRERPGFSPDVRGRSLNRFQMPLRIWNRFRLCTLPATCFALGKLPTNLAIHQG